MRFAILLVLALACAGSSSDPVDPPDDSAGDEAAASPVPATVPAALEAGVTELYRLANGARHMAGEAIQAECEECWPPEVELLEEGLEPVDLQPRALAETLEKLVVALEPIRGRPPFDTLADALVGQRQELLARQEPFEPSEVLARATAALEPIRAAITAEAALAPAEPVLCTTGVRLGSLQMALWELEIARAIYAATRAEDEDEQMRILGIMELSRRHFEALSAALEEGPEAAASAIRAKLVFLRSLDSVFDRGDDEAVLTATADLCAPTTS